MLVDSHCHLDWPDFAEDIDDVVKRARAAGIGRIVTIATTISRLQTVLAISNRFSDVFCTVGIHPQDVVDENMVSADSLVKLSAHPRIIGIGETGLDYYHGHALRERQQDSFRYHIRAACQTGLPLIIHTRNAESDTIQVLEEEGAGQVKPLQLTGLIHCFSGSLALAERALSWGFYLSLSGIITFSTANSLRDIIARIPLERLLVETDAPFLAPVPQRGKRNEPAFIKHVVTKLAEIKQVSPEAVAQHTTTNFFSLFAKISADS
jgi:TatD DNase family protein